MDIKEIAERIRIEVLDQYGMKHRYTQKEAMMKQAQEALVAEIQRQSEPVAEAIRQFRNGDLEQTTVRWINPDIPHMSKLFTYPPTAEQIAKAEQRVAEACALYIHSTKGAVGSINMAEAVLSGDWRKFVKGE